MAEDLYLSAKDTINFRKKYPLFMRMIILAFSLLCGLYVWSYCLKQISNRTMAGFLNVQVIQMPCTKPQIELSEVPSVHFPEPHTYSRAKCACNPVRNFAIFSMQRSGSGWFETLLNNHTNINSNGEMFSVKGRRTNVSTIIETLDKIYNLDWLSSASKNECTAAVGLKWMLNQGIMQHHEEIAEYLRNQGVSIIFLFRRNLLRRMVSVLANSYDRDNKLLNGTHKSHVPICQFVVNKKLMKFFRNFVPSGCNTCQIQAYYNATLLISDLRQIEETTVKALEYFKSTRHIILYYEDIVMNRNKIMQVQDFLKVPRRNLRSRQVKIHGGSLSELVKNWDEVKTALHGTPYESFLHEG